MVYKISIYKALALENAQLIDVRTPAEYAEDHILGAMSIPLLSDQERAEIGTIYKQISRDKAIERGLELFGPKVPTIVKMAMPYRTKTLVVYCARGGMRSGIIASLLESLGFEVLRIEGGYKAFRSYILERLYNFDFKPQVYVLWGLTCSGKTKLLKLLPHHLDLEGLAQHRGSLYGGLGLKPVRQKRFENILYHELLRLNNVPYIFVEGESRKIGDCQMPEFLYKAIIHGEHILLRCSQAVRIQRMVEEYFTTPEQIEEIKKITKTLWKVISNSKKEQLLHCIGNKDYVAAGKIFLEDYYDQLYSHTLQKRKYIFEVESDDLGKAKVEIMKITKMV